jgi:hypothetical protein
MDPISLSRLNPDQHSHQNLDPDPHKANAAPKHCLQGTGIDAGYRYGTGTNYSVGTGNYTKS